MDLRITTDNSPLQCPLTSASEIDDKIRAEVEHAIKHTSERITTIDDKLRELVDIRTGLTRHLDALLSWTGPSDQRPTPHRSRAPHHPWSNLMTETNPASCALLRAHGIDSHEIPINGWDRYGYQTVRRNDDGQVIIDGDHIATTHHPWPHGFDYATLESAWAEDRAAETARTTRNVAIWREAGRRILGKEAS